MLSLPLVVNGFSNTEFGVTNPLSISPGVKERYAVLLSKQIVETQLVVLQ